MAEDGAAEDRTEAATPRRRARAREEGRVPLSREATSLATLVAGAGMLLLAGPALARSALHDLAVLLAGYASISAGAGALLALRVLAATATPVVLAVLAASVAATLAQTGLLFHAGALMPDIARVSPMAGLRRLFGIDGLAEAARAFAKLAAGLFALRAAFMPLLARLPGGLYLPEAGWPGLLHAALLRLAVAAIAVQAASAGVDLAWVRWRHARSLRMSREDVRQEHKESEGDPAVKGRIRRLRLARARRRMLASVPKATVVITNPTHYAVALFYQNAQGAAPRVVAKGIDHMAARIRAVAEEHRVPMVANPPLARALHTVDIDAEIPAEHFQAVAQIIAYIWRLDRRTARL